jgi:uncharacterized protein YhaN
MIIVGCALTGCGGVAIALRRIWGMPGLDVGAINIPMELWSGYLVLLAGVGAITWGATRRSSDPIPYELLTGEWQIRHDGARGKIIALDIQITELCANLEITQTDMEYLDALDARLDADRELCATNDVLQHELDVYADELNIAHDKIQTLEKELSGVMSRVQALRKRWHEYMQNFGVKEVALPEEAPAYFVRVEAARLAWAGVLALETEMREMERHITELMHEARQTLPRHTLPANWNVPVDVMEAVRRVLESCREADLMAEERARAAEARRGAESVVKRAEQSQNEAVYATAEAEERLRLTRESWQKTLSELGLELDLSPSTTREALECMDRCLTFQAEQTRLSAELQNHMRERDALIRPFQSLLSRLARQAGKDPDGQPDWLGTLDAMLRDLDMARQAEEEYARLERLQQDLQEEKRVNHISETDARQHITTLLAMAGVDDIEEFRRKAQVMEERETLTRRRQDVEDALNMAADKTPLGEFLESFADLDRALLEKRARELADELEASSDHEQTLADNAGTLRANLSQLSSSENLTEQREKDAALTENMRRMGMEWSRHALAYYLLAESKRRFEKERQPKVIRMASDMFSSISDGEWASVAASLEDSTLLVMPARGESVFPEHLSRGAQEQLYLSLRMAHIRNHAALGVSLPVIMDDILVNFDHSRATRTARMLNELTRPTPKAEGHQIFYFTCHPHMVQLLQEAVPDAALYNMDRGQIRAV